MAAGATVADLAAEAGHSERELFRMLRDTYGRIGTPNRAGHGLLEDQDRERIEEWHNLRPDRSR